MVDILLFNLYATVADVLALAMYSFSTGLELQYQPNSASMGKNASAWNLSMETLQFSNTK